MSFQNCQALIKERCCSSKPTPASISICKNFETRLMSLKHMRSTVSSAETATKTCSHSTCMASWYQPLMTSEQNLNWSKVSFHSPLMIIPRREKCYNQWSELQVQRWAEWGWEGSWTWSGRNNQRGLGVTIRAIRGHLFQRWGRGSASVWGWQILGGGGDEGRNMAWKKDRERPKVS